MNILANTINSSKREFQTYKAWKSAVKKIDPSATFVGDKDIDGSSKKGMYDAEWDGAIGYIEVPANIEEILALLTRNKIAYEVAEMGTDRQYSLTVEGKMIKQVNKIIKLIESKGAKAEVEEQEDEFTNIIISLM